MTNQQILSSLTKEERSLLGKDGKCDSLELFDKLLKAFPGEKLTLVLRNFNSIGGMRVAQVHTEGFPSPGIDRVYLMDIVLGEVFPELQEWIQHNEEEGWINCVQFIRDGAKLAGLLRRPLELLHQYGSGNPAEADFDTYGPFNPA